MYVYIYIYTLHMYYIICICMYIYIYIYTSCVVSYSCSLSVEGSPLRLSFSHVLSMVFIFPQMRLSLGRSSGTQRQLTCIPYMVASCLNSGIRDPLAEIYVEPFLLAVFPAGLGSKLLTQSRSLAWALSVVQSRAEKTGEDSWVVVEP